MTKRMTWLLCLLGVACSSTSPAPVRFVQQDVKATPFAEPPPVTPQTRTSTLTLSIEEASLRALETNPDLKVQRYAPVVAGTFAAIERGVFDPEVYASVVLGREQASVVARATSERFDVSNTNTDAEVGVRQRLPTGTTLEASVRHGYDISNRTPRQEVGRLGLTITQSLLRGFGPAVNLASLDRAALDLDASLAELAAYAQSILRATEVAYWRYASATQEIVIHEQSFEVAKRQAQDVAHRIEVGLLPEIESAAVQAEVALRRQGLIDAQSRKEEARLRLARSLGGRAPLKLKILATSTIGVARPSINNLEERVALALQSRPELREARVRLQQNRLDTMVTDNGLLPRLDFFIALGKTGFGASTGQAVRNFDEDTYDVLVGLDFSEFIGRRARSAENRAAGARRQQAMAAVANLEQLVEFEVRLAANEVERARAQIEATATTRKLQERTLAAEQERYSVGTGTALLLAQAQRDLLSSRIAEVQAMVDYRVALVALHEAEGTLLDRHGFVLADDS